MMLIESRQSNSLAVLNYDADLCGNIEQALKGLQGYGIMALELIQNADDAGARRLTFDATTHGLIVWNNAEFTSCGLESPKCPWEQEQGPDGQRRPCNFHAISRMGGRSKLHAENQIGRFGIGFVSVYQITDKPIIRSVGTQIVLDPLTREVPASKVAMRAGTEFELPWATEKSEMRAAINASPTPPGVVGKVLKEVQEALRSSLLFLRNLEQVEVRDAGRLCLMVKIERKEDEVTLSYSPDQKDEKWLVLSRKADDLIADRNLLGNYEILGDLKRSTKVSVAIPLDTVPPDGLLFAYLPTQHKTGLPVHINADFFPHASRQEIVLKGEGHERHWNEVLIAAAAASIGENLPLLRDKLGHVRLWQVGAAAYSLRDEGAFGVFWKQFAAAAQSVDSVWTTSQEWGGLASTYLVADNLTVNEQEALVSLDFDLLHPDLRPHWTPLSSIGLRMLRLQMVVNMLQKGSGAVVYEGSPHLRPLWGAISRLIENERKEPQLALARIQLAATKFLIDVDGEPAAPNHLWRPTSDITANAVRQFIPQCPFAHPNALSHPEIAELIDAYELDNLAEDLAASIVTEDDAGKVIGADPGAARGLYSLMMSFDNDTETTDAASILADTPFLRTKEGFVAPADAQLPGGFEDPMGRFSFVDASVFVNAGRIPGQMGGVKAGQ